MSHQIDDVIAQLAALREERGWSLTEVSEKAGLGRVQIHNWEKGHNRPRWGSLVEWAKLFGYRVAMTLVPLRAEPADEELRASVSRLSPDLKAEVLRFIRVLEAMPEDHRRLLTRYVQSIEDDLPRENLSQGSQGA